MTWRAYVSEKRYDYILLGLLPALIWINVVANDSLPNLGGVSVVLDVGCLIGIAYLIGRNTRRGGWHDRIRDIFYVGLFVQFMWALYSFVHSDRSVMSYNFWLTVLLSLNLFWSAAISWLIFRIESWQLKKVP